jgi:hypothetical protein
MMNIRSIVIVIAIFAAAAFTVSDAAIAQQTSLTLGVGGVFPAGATLNGLRLESLRSGSGLQIDGSVGTGQFSAALTAVGLLGQTQTITIDGRVSAGSRLAVNVATFSGTCTVDMGDGTPPLAAVPFAVTVTSNESEQGTIGLVLGSTSLPAATINQGSLTIR